jgi:hypothetical protein
MFTDLNQLRARVGHALVLAAVASFAACTNDETTPLRSAPGAPRRDVTPTIVVTNTNDAGAGSLRQAIASATDGDVIGFDASIAGQTITLSTGQLLISSASTILGSQTKGMTISGGGASRVFEIQSAGNVTLRNLSIVNGSASLGTSGGGIALLTGNLTLDHSLVSGNSAGSPLAGGAGGGIYVDGNATLTVTNATITKNSAELGGGIYLNAGTVDATNLTITNNAAHTGGGARSNGPTGTAFTLRNSIVALNSAGGDCAFGGPLTLAGTNLIGDTSCGSAGSGIIVADPMLAALADNGGPTQTQALLAGSPAIDAATNCTVTDDQRYVARPLGAACDIGAYEFDNRPKVTIAIDANGTVNPSTGAALITGTVTCSAPVSIQLQVGLAQDQKVRRATTTVQASDVTTIACVTSKPWSIILTPSSGAFVNSAASATANTVNPSGQIVPVSAAATVKLFWGHT